MKRGPFTALFSLGAATLVLGAAMPALADGNLVITNRTIDGPVTVQVRQGSSVDHSVPAMFATLKKGESATCDETNLQYFWRRQVTPGDDSQWTAWVTIDTRGGNQKASF